MSEQHLSGPIIKQEDLGAAMDFLASLVPDGELLLATDPLAFVEATAEALAAATKERDGLQLAFNEATAQLHAARAELERVRAMRLLGIDYCKPAATDTETPPEPKP